MPQQIVFVIQNRALPAHKQNCLVIPQQPHLIRLEQFASACLPVHAVAAVAAAASVVGRDRDRFLADQLRNILVRALLVAAQVQKFVAQTDQRLPVVFVHGLELRHVLRDDRAENTARTHGRQRRQKTVLGQRNVREFVDQQMHRHGQPSPVDAVSLTVERLNELAVNHADQIVERFVRIRDAAEQRNLAFSEFFQMQFVGHSQPCDLRQIECRQPNANADQNRTRRLARCLLENTVLFAGNAVRLAHFQAFKQNVQR